MRISIESVIHLRSLSVWQCVDERGNRSLFSPLCYSMYFTSTTSLSILGTGRLLNCTVVAVNQYPSLQRIWLPRLLHVIHKRLLLHHLLIRYNPSLFSQIAHPVLACSKDRYSKLKIFGALNSHYWVQAIRVEVK